MDAEREPIATDDVAATTILVVDDERNVRATLRRLIRMMLPDVTVVEAESAEAASALLRSTHVDVLISDERMGGVPGHKFVQFTRMYFPDVVRIILTGHADKAAMRAAITRGEVFRYLHKPWNDDELVAVVQNAIDFGRVSRERTRIERELRRANEQLEEALGKRSEELSRALEYIRGHTDLEHRDDPAVVHALVDLITGGPIADLAPAAQLALRIARRLGTTERDQALARGACMVAPLGAAALGVAGEHPLTEGGAVKRRMTDLSAQMLASGLRLGDLGAVVRHLPEHFDGSGEPEGLAGEAIPLATRIAVVAMVAHRHARRGRGDGWGVAERVEALRTQTGRFDPAVVDAFEATIRTTESGATT